MIEIVKKDEMCEWNENNLLPRCRKKANAGFTRYPYAISYREERRGHDDLPKYTGDPFDLVKYCWKHACFFLLRMQTDRQHAVRLEDDPK